MLNIDLNNNCCTVETLKKCKLLFQNNSEQYVLYQCRQCQTYWLYKKLEEKWFDNLQLKEHEYEAWYIKIASQDMPYVLKLEFDKMFFTDNYLYIATNNHKPKLTCKDKNE